MRFLKLIPILVAALLLPVTASPAFAASEPSPNTVSSTVKVDDQAGFFKSDEAVKKELKALQGKDGVDWYVTVPKDSKETDATKLSAKILKDQNKLDSSSVSIVIVPESNAIGVSYGEKLRNAIPMEALSNSLDKDLMPHFEKGEYDEGVVAMARSLNMMISAEGETGGTSSFSEWAKKNASSFLVAIIAFIVFLVALILIPTFRARRQLEEQTEELQAQLKKRKEDVQSFWNFTSEEIKNEFVLAPNREAREAVIEKVFDKQSFMDTVPHLTNVVGSFFYPGKIAEAFSIQHFIDAENSQAEAAAATRIKWESLTLEQQTAFKEAGGERDQNELIAKFFPDEDKVEVLAARFSVMIPEAKNTDPNFITLMDEKIAEDLAKNPPKEKKRGFLR